MKTNNKGFSLVELIVVIAIMAVLAAVAVIGVSIYIPKAQEAADRQLVSDIEQVMNLYYQGSETPITGGYVILKPNKGQAVVSDDKLDSAMKEAFGEDWATKLSLACDDWKGNDLLNVVSKYDPEVAALIMNSTFMQNPDGMLDATTNLLGIASDKIVSVTGSDAAAYLAELNPELNAKLESMGLEPGTEAYSNAVSNLLVGHFADAMKSKDEQTPSDEPDATANVSDLVIFYAQVYAFSEKYEKNSETKTMIETLDELIAASDYDTISGSKNVSSYKRSLTSHSKWNELKEFLNGNNDKDAFSEMMQAVSVVANGYQNDKESLVRDDLYSSDAVKGQVNQLTNALTARMEGKFPAESEVGSNDVLIILYPDGSIDCSIGK